MEREPLEPVERALDGGPVELEPRGHLGQRRLRRLATGVRDGPHDPRLLGEPVRLRWPPAGANPPRLILDDLVDPANAHHHAPERLATAVMGAWERESRIRRRPAIARAGRTA